MKDFDEQREYYNSRWGKQRYIKPIGLLRLMAILEAFHKTELICPRILDLGSGTGWLSSIFNEFGPTTGIELSPKAVERAHSNYPSVDFIADNLFENTLEEAGYDLVISQEVIEHVENQEAYISIIAHCLRKGGYLILTTPNARNLRYWRKEELESWNLQPIENWLTASGLKTLLNKGHLFEMQYSKTIVPFFGSKGIFRIIKACTTRLDRFLKRSKLKNSFLIGAGFGLHIVVLAKRL